ncbi:DHA2 family efflux MFS transporter permease subunit [Desulforamulus ruminis]|uniref:Drug resistance transporter, EmrB/QacA subfamily n=1 Tax=Desulforamulus ruminis (strain ATCC 23193 / DSM 2154 / NCIMB 8452 / DL) TaxID=696281 RepID=F6DPT5_DESRL|nr:DHA2 family efflux MFS transporter permease subunit [Desulforamulus ruminis]AEG60774.1 drug resistance transporter, EmrB/QacA subfamily [Desulforamulus ruminis DSM 2154]
MQSHTAAEKEASFWLPLFVLVIGAFAAILNSSSINVAIPKLMSIFGVSANDIQWVITAYMLTSAVVIPITGYLGDRFGGKRVYILSTAAFTAGSILCAFAWSSNSLIVFRVIQGIGGGIIMPITMVLIYRIVPIEKIGLALGVWGMAAVMGPAVGPTVGGYILEHFSWRLLFIINVPVGIVGVLLSIYLLKETPIKKDTKFDFWGFLFAAVGFFALLLALSQGSKEGWSSYYIVMLFILSFFTLLLFVLVELFSEDPMMDLRLLKNKTFLYTTIVGSLINIGLYGGVFLTPLFAQNLMGLSAYDTGILLFPSAMVSGVMMPVSGILFDKFGAKVVGLIGVTITAVATLDMYHLDVNTSQMTVVIIMCIRSFGIGLSMMPLMTAGMNVVAKHLIGRASSLGNVIRQVASSFGIAVLTTIMQNRQTFHAATLSEGVSYSSPVAANIIKQVQGALLSSGAGSDDSTSGAISMVVGLVQKQAMALAINDTFLISALFVFAAIPLIFLINEKKKPAPAGMPSPGPDK